MSRTITHRLLPALLLAAAAVALPACHHHEDADILIGSDRPSFRLDASPDAAPPATAEIELASR